MTEKQGLHRSVIALGFVSFFMDVSSEAIHSLLPLFMVNVLGLSALAVGLIDGGTESLKLFFKPLSGWLSDRFQHRKYLTAFGYGLAACTKPLFALAQGLPLIITARLLDRTGKGIRGAPRDALIADITPKPLRGRAYGLRQAMDTAGALVGPLLAALAMWWLHDNYRLVFWLAAIPAVLSVSILLLFVREPEHQKNNEDKNGEDAESPPFSKTYWLVVAVACAMALARPSEAFLLLRGRSVGLSESETPLLFATMNIVYAASVYPVGKWFDDIGPRRLLIASMVILLAAMLVLRFADFSQMIWLGAALWGLHLGSSQGILAALISLHAPELKRGTAFGLYALLTGLALVANGAVVGTLWQQMSPAMAYNFAVVMSVLALLACWQIRVREK